MAPGHSGRLTVDGWRVWSLGSYGCASRNFSIQEFLRAHFSKPPNLEELRCDLHPGEMIDHATNDRAVREHFEELFPGVEPAASSISLPLVSSRHSDTCSAKDFTCNW